MTAHPWGPLHKTFTGEKTLAKSENLGNHEFTTDFTIGRKLWIKLSFSLVKVLCNRPQVMRHKTTTEMEILHIWSLCLFCLRKLLYMYTYIKLATQIYMYTHTALGLHTFHVFHSEYHTKSAHVYFSLGLQVHFTNACSICIRKPRQ